MLESCFCPICLKMFNFFLYLFWVIIYIGITIFISLVETIFKLEQPPTTPAPTFQFNYG